MKPIKVLFVCMGNICRSPTAHGIFQKMVTDSKLDDFIEVESAGTIAYHAGEHPDRRAIETAKRREVNLSSLIARQVSFDDYQTQNHILAMDYSNLNEMIRNCPETELDKIELLLSYHPDGELIEVPDPYYGGSQGFENVFNMVEEASRRLLQHIRTLHSI